MNLHSALYPATAAPSTHHQLISNDLNQFGWSVVDEYVPSNLLTELFAESLLLRETRQYRSAAISSGEVLSTERCDIISWINPVNCLPAQQQYMQQLNRLRIFLNRENYLGLNDLELHAAIYPENSFYKKHHDNFKKRNQRILTIILYLNKDWQPGNGGQLRLYLPKQSIDIEPIGGRLVAFLSESFPHEVLTTHRERFSLTGWFRRNELPH